MCAAGEYRTFLMQAGIAPKLYGREHWIPGGICKLHEERFATSAFRPDAHANE